MVLGPGPHFRGGPQNFGERNETNYKVSENDLNSSKVLLR
jgi:hypothetical protein